VERPALVTIGVGGRQRRPLENGDYLYGSAGPRDRPGGCVSPRSGSISPRSSTTLAGQDRVFFGATVTYEIESSEERAATIVGVDEPDAGSERILALAAGDGAHQGAGRRRGAAHAAWAGAAHGHRRS
jgi:transcription elongation factor GreB